MPKDPILELKNVHAGYGSIKALKGISLKVFPGEIVAMIGANGAGKTTTLMVVCGIVPVETGEVVYKGKVINHMAPEKLPTIGLCQIPEGRRIFPRLTVSENLELGAFYRKDRGAIEQDLERVFTLFPILAERKKQQGGTLSGGEQQMLAIARGLDEPAEGASDG